MFFFTGCFDEIDVFANTFLILVAGYESIAPSITYCLYELTVHQNVLNELREEVEAAYKANNQILRLDWVETLKYLDAVVAGQRSKWYSVMQNTRA